MLVLVEFYDKRRIGDEIVAGRYLRALDKFAVAAQVAEGVADSLEGVSDGRVGVIFRLR